MAAFILFIFHWPESSPVSTPSCKIYWKCSPSLGSVHLAKTQGSLHVSQKEGVDIGQLLAASSVLMKMPYLTGSHP